MNQGTDTNGLTLEQLGHLRHFDNLSRQPPNDWSLMKGRGVGQDDFGGYRFQLAYMGYGLALAHVFRLPAAPGLFQPIFERLMVKMLLPEVWIYWHDVSRGGTVFNQHLAANYREEWDPVRRDNIMYSAYVQSIALLYNYLFDDNRYAQAGALTFKFWSYFWGGEPKVFRYGQNSLNEHIYWLMVESGYLGVACEPNCIFQICNQPAILGFRLHDLLTGGNRAQEVTQSYEAAWQEYDRLGANGHYQIMLSEDTKKARPNVAQSPCVDAWCGALMNMWNREFVHRHYTKQICDLVVEGPNATLCVRTQPRPPAMGETIVGDDCDFGWVAAWASEMGDRKVLEGLLRHADQSMRPTWRSGGLYYPRNDSLEDADGNRTLMEPHTGNVLLGYARLNVPDGLWRLYNEPLARSFYDCPALVEVGEGVNAHRAVYTKNVLAFTLSPRESMLQDVTVSIGRLPWARPWTLRCDGEQVARGTGLSIEKDTRLDISPGDGVLKLQGLPPGIHVYEWIAT